MGENDKSLRNPNAFLKFVYFLTDCIEKPLGWIHDNIVEKNRQEYYWYHQKYRRVPTIDECYIDDYACIYEADQQYKRDRSVDKSILHILRKRYENCELDSKDEPYRCAPLFKYYENAITNYFIKYGDLGLRHSATSCYMKQKHRMAWERRHGPVGSGRRDTKKEPAQEAEE